MLIILPCIVACHKKYDQPQLKTLNESAKLGIAELKGRVPLSNSHYHFAGGDTNLYCTVTMDENSGNLYKQVYVKDDNGIAMQLNLLNSGGLFSGDRVR